MAKSFDTMVAEVVADIGDTSAAFTTKVGRKVNARYGWLRRKLGLEEYQVDNDYTAVSVLASSEVDMETNFWQEISVTDITNGTTLTRMTQQEFLQTYPYNYASTTLTTGCPAKYYVVRDETPVKIVFDVKADAVYTYAIPYRTIHTLMTTTDTVTITGCEDLLIIGARSDAWRIKRQYQKAAADEALWAKQMGDFLHSEVATPNQIIQFTPSPYLRDYS